MHDPLQHWKGRHTPCEAGEWTYVHSQGMLGKPSELVRGMGILLISFFLEIFIFMYMGFACVYACASYVFLVPTGARRGRWIPWNCSYRPPRVCYVGFETWTWVLCESNLSPAPWWAYSGRINPQYHTLQGKNKLLLKAATGPSLTGAAQLKLCSVCFCVSAFSSVVFRYPLLPL